MALVADEQMLIRADVRRLQGDTEPDELVLPQESGMRLGWIANWLVQPLPVFREWGLQRYIDTGLRALFRGRSGTGKTMAATALGQSTERPVFAVDMGLIVSGALAETEALLRRLFETAREERAILVFDEADALLAGNASGAAEPLAGHNFAYLLRQIEVFDGLAILMTNQPAQIDPLALSRIDVVVEFPMPDAAAREQLWRKILAQVKLPQGGDVDVAALARDYDLTGSDILRCVRMGAMLASSRELPLGMELLQLAAAERRAMNKLPEL